MSDFPHLNKGIVAVEHRWKILQANYFEASSLCPAATDLETHFQAYADHYELHKYIKYETSITKIERDDAQDKWKLHIKGPDGENVLSFDKLVAANGLQNKAVFPATPGIENYSGLTMHSQEFKDR